jgi:hypothetical protein
MTKSSKIMKLDNFSKDNKDFRRQSIKNSIMSANALIELEDLEVSNKKRSLWIKFIVKFILCLVRTIFGIFYFLHYWHHKNEKYSFKSELRKWELFFFLFINVLIRQISFWALLIYFISN